MTDCACSPDAVATQAKDSVARGDKLNSTHRREGSAYPGLVHLPAGTAYIGTDNPVIAGDREGPLQAVSLSAYALAATTVTVEQFAAFVLATGYVTDAERAGQSLVFKQQVSADARIAGCVFGTPWWQAVYDASWRNPTGASHGWHDVSSEPVVHVSWQDALAYCEWAGGRLPAEVEWEHAARGGLGDVHYPWGNAEPVTAEPRRCNIWEGEFPAAPLRKPQPVNVESFQPNEFGFYNMCGNVWEWTADAFDNGFGPETNRRTLKGGSYLCHKSYCYRYRIAARIGVSEHSTTSHQGFRIAFNV